MVEEPYVPIEGVAKHFSVSISTVRSWIRGRVVPSLKIGGVYRFKLTEVDAALRKIGAEEPLSSELNTDSVQLELNFNPNEDL